MCWLVETQDATCSTGLNDPSPHLELARFAGIVVGIGSHAGV